MTEQGQAATFRQWALVEIFGHERIAGEVSEQTIGGEGFIRVDVPAVNGQAAFTRLYGGKAIYSITPVSEDIARRAAASMQARPVTVYLLPTPSEQDDDLDEGPDEDEQGGDFGLDHGDRP